MLSILVFKAQIDNHQKQRVQICNIPKMKSRKNVNLLDGSCYGCRCEGLCQAAHFALRNLNDLTVETQRSVDVQFGEMSFEANKNM